MTPIRNVSTLLAVFQAALPFLVFCLPALLVCLALLACVRPVGIGTAVGMAVQWMPTLKPLATIFIVHPYRRALLRRLHLGWAVAEPSSTMTAASSAEEESMTISRERSAAAASAAAVQPVQPAEPADQVFL